jgi:sigma-B regulation protein RsbU (phosphoserine phosphatase)
MAKAGPVEYALLVVDDNEDNRYTLTRRLKREGYTSIAVAENGRQALDMLKAQPFDLVLLDIMMPEVNGYEVLERMKADAQLRHVPVIMISAVGEMDSVIRCIELGAEDYLPKPFNPTLLRARVGASLEKKHLRDESMLYVRRLERDLETAREIQLSMVPTDFPVAENSRGLEVYAVLQPAYEVGGDFYDFFWLSPERLCVLVADVSDKGASAALHMARAKASIRFLCDSEDSGYMPNTAELVERIDRELSRDNPHAMFITLLLAVVNARTGEIEWCNAGHNPPCILSAEGAITVLGGECGIPVGIDPKYFRSAETAQLLKGGSLFIYTDGITEAMDSEQTMFGVERLETTLRACVTPAAQAPREVIAAVLGAAKPSDDITMLACRWHG